MEQQIRYCTTSDGVSIAYAEVGEGPPIVRALGWFTNLELEWESENTRDFWQQLATGHRLLRYDGRGIGLSGEWRDAFTGETRLRDLEAVVEAAGLEQFALFGQSEGVATAIRYAAAHPDRVTKLVLVGGMLKFGRDDGPSQAGREQQQALLTLVRSGWGRNSPQFRQFFTSTFIPSASPEQATWFNEMQRRSARPEVAAALLESIYATDAREAAERVTTPTVVIHRRDDQAVLFSWGRRVASTIRGARLVPLEGSNHLLGLDPAADEAVIRATLEFLDGTAHGLPTIAPRSSGAFRTILFTDVVASTPLLAQLKDAKMREVMRDHDEVLAAAVKGNGGRVIKTIGDAFMAEFAVPSNAVDAAIAAQRNLRDRFADSDVPVRIRIGINAGEPIEEDGDLHGASVVIAKRLESAAEINGILVSDVVKQAVAGKDFAFEDRGEVALKGFDEPVRAWAVRWELT